MAASAPRVMTPLALRVSAGLPAAAAVAGAEASPRAEAAYDHLVSAKPQKSFTIHIGGNLRLPSRRAPSPSASPSPTAATARNPFDGVPLAAWAERLGGRVMPAYEAAMADHRAGVAAARAAAGEAAAAPPASSIPFPHFLPFTRWAAASPAVRATLVAPAPADRPKARLSWYHPDDGMVPRGWWRAGLLADLAYYKPFQAVEGAAPAAAA